MKRLFTCCLLVMMLMVMGFTTAMAQKSVLDESFSSGKPAGWTVGDWKFDDGNALFTSLYENTQDTLITPLLDLSDLNNKPSVSITYSNTANGDKANELIVYYRASENAPWSTWKTFTEATDGQVTVKDVLPDGLDYVQIKITGVYKLGAETRVYRLAVENKTEASDAPTGLDITELTTDSVWLLWDGTQSPLFVQYNLKVNSSKMTDMSAEADIVDMVGWNLREEWYQLENLKPNTEYWFYVQYDCGDGDVSPWAEMSFRTPCEAISGSFAEDFEGEISTCYTIVKGGATAAVSGEYPYNSTKSFKSNSAAGKYNYFILPEFNGDVKNFQVSFIAAAADGGNTYARTVTVGVCTEATAESFVEVKTLDLPKGRTWEQIVVTLKGYTGNGKYIAFRFGNQDKENRLFMDDIRIEAASACPKPMFLQVSEITPNSAKLAWAETGNANEWNLVLSTKPLSDPEDIEPDASKGEYAGSVSANPYTATGLNANTTYYAYVQAGCGSSSWTNAVEFKTAKEVNFPYFEDFSRLEADVYTDAIGALPNGWVVDNRCVNTEYYFDYYYKDTYLPYVVTTQSHDASAYVNASLYLRGTGKPSEENLHKNAYYSSIAMLPAMPKDVKGLTVTFWAKSTNGTQTLVVGVANTQTADLAQGQQLDVNIIKVDSVEISGNSTWTKYSVNLKSYVGSGRYITFYLKPGTGTPSVYVDEISIDDTPDCAAVTGLTVVANGTSKADVSWADATSTTKWYVKVSSTAIDPSAADGDIVAKATATSKEYAVSGLSMGTKYYVYVSPTCGDMWESAEVTTGVGLEVPYYTEFTGETTGAVAARGPKNWVLGNTSMDSWTTSTYVPYLYTSSWTNRPADESTPYLYIQNSTTATTQYPYAIMPELLNADAKDLVMSFYAYWNNNDPSSPANYACIKGKQYGPLKIGIVNSPSDINKTNKFSNVTYVKSVYVKAAKAAEKVYVDLSNYTGSGKYIVFYQDTAKNNYMCIDNLRIAKATDPWKVSDITASEQTENSAKLTWTENGKATQWEVRVFDALQENPAAGTPAWSDANLTSQEATITGLKHSTQYYVYVRSIQASGKSDWESTSFYTECGTWSIPFYEDWNSYATGSTTNKTMHPCYNVEHSTASTYPYVRGYTGASVYHESKSNLMYLNAGTGKVCQLEFPKLNVPVNTLQMELEASPYSSSFGAKFITFFGVVTSDGTFHEVAQRTNGAKAWETWTIDFSGYTGEDGVIAIRLDPTMAAAASGTAATAQYIFIENVKINTIPVCKQIQPNDIEFTEVGPDSATIAWPAAEASKWNLKVSSSAMEDPAAATADIFDGEMSVTSKKLTGIEDNTWYYVYVQTVRPDKECVGDWSRAAKFKTTCFPRQFPYEENFDEYTTTGAGNLPDCSNICGQDADHSYISTKNSNKCLYVNQKAAGHKNYFVFPALNSEDVRKLQLSMQVYVGTTATTKYYYQVGIMTNPYDPATFVALHTEELLGSANAYDRVYKFDGYQGDETGTKFGGYVAICPQDYVTSANKTGYTSLYIDNVTIDLIPTCAAPVDLKVESVGSYDAQFSWKTDDKTAAHRVRVFTSANVDPSNDAFVAEIVANDSITTVEGLDANKIYYAFVRKECAPNDVSKWSSTVSFRTDCAPLQSMPYVEDFEAGTVNQTPDCWTSVILYGTNSSAKAQITLNGSLNNAYESEQAMSVNYYVQGSSSGATGQTSAAAVTPALDVESLKDVVVYFDLKAGASGRSFKIEAVSDNTPDADAIYITTIENVPTTWTKAYIKIADYYTSVQPYNRLRFVPILPAGVTSSTTIYIDNIVFTKDLNVVLPITRLKTEKVDVDSITVSFVESTPGIESWQVAYVAEGGDIADATILSVDTTVVTIKGLAANTSYDVYARSTAEGMEWIGPITTSTIGQPVALPYSTGFEEDGDQWKMYNLCNDGIHTYPNFWIIGKADSCAGTGTNALFITNDSSSYQSYETNNGTNMDPEKYAYQGSNITASSYTWATLNIRIENPGTYMFAFKAKSPSTYSSSGLYAQLIPAGAKFKGETATLISGATRSGKATSASDANGCYLAMNAVNAVSDWTWYRRSVDITEAGVYTLAIYSYNYSTGSPYTQHGAVDSVTIEEYFCTVPADIELTSISTEQASFKWFAGRCKNFEYVVSRYAKLGNPALIDAEDKIAHGFLSEGPQVSISNLETTTSYSFYVRTICSDGPTEWVEYRFNTPCVAEVLPYTEAFAETPECWIFSGATVGTCNYYTEEMKAAELEVEKWPALTMNNNGIAVLPELNLPLNRINVELAAFAATNDAFVSLGVVDNTWDMSTFKELAQLNLEKTGSSISSAISGNGSGYAYKVKTLSKMLNLYQGNGKYLAIRNISGQTAYIKYVKLTELADCIQPYQVEVTNITENGASVYWIAGAEEAWEVKVDDNEPIATNEMPYRITGLEQGTAYSVSVRAICDETHQSEWSAAVNFQTTCGVNPLPMIEDFSGLVKGEKANLRCWDNMISEQTIEAMFAGNGTMIPVPKSRATAYIWAANGIADLGGVDQLSALDAYTYSSGSQYNLYKYKWFISPQYAIEGKATLSFDARICGYHGEKVTPQGRFFVAISTDNGASWKKEDAYNLTEKLDSVYKVQSISLEKYAGQNIRVAFYHEGLATTYKYLLIDNVRMNCTDTYPIADNACEGHDYEGYGFSIQKEDLPLAGQDSTYYRFAANNEAGCDSTVALTITTRQAPAIAPVYATICQGEVYEFGPYSLTKPNPEGQPYYLSGQTQYGCDSTIYLYLTVTPADTIDEPIIVNVDNTQLPFTYDEYYTVPADAPIGQPFDAYVKVGDCSFNWYQVTVSQCTALYDYEDQVCANAEGYEGYGFSIAAADFAPAGQSKQFNRSALDEQGCDSLITLTLKTNALENTELEASICEHADSYEGYNFVIGKAEWPAVGESKAFYQYLQTVEGCDSTVILTLTVNKADTTDIDVEALNTELPKIVDDYYTVPEDAQIGQPFEVVLPTGECAFNHYTVLISKCKQNAEPYENAICENVKSYADEIFNIAEDELPAVGASKEFTEVKEEQGCEITYTLTLTVTKADTTVIPVAINIDAIPYYVDALYTIEDAQVGSFEKLIESGDCAYNLYEVTISDIGTGLINLTDEVESVEVYDALGRKVRTLRHGDEQFNLPVGVYMLHTIMKSGAVINSKVTLK